MYIDEMKAEVKTNQKWTSPDGVTYTVFNNKLADINKRIDMRVKAYTHDLSVEESNGTWQGKPCHWVNMWTISFVEKFVRA